MAASASPEVTLASVDFTSSSSDLGFTVTPAFCNACRLYAPAGTEGSSSTTTSPGWARSARPVMCLGLPGATTISSLLRAKTRGASTRPASTSFCMLFWSADANTSAGAPCWIWVTSAWEPAKLYVTVRWGAFEASVAFSAVNASVSDAAANTVRLPVRGKVVAAVLVLGPQPPSTTDRATSQTAIFHIVAMRLEGGEEAVHRHRRLQAPASHDGVEARGLVHPRLQPLDHGPHDVALVGHQLGPVRP